MHVLQYHHVTVTNPVILQRFLVVHQRQPIEGDHHLVDWHVALDLAQSLETLQFHVLDHVQDENVVAERGYSYLHRVVQRAQRTYLIALRFESRACTTIVRY